MSNKQGGGGRGKGDRHIVAFLAKGSSEKQSEDDRHFGPSKGSSDCVARHTTTRSKMRTLHRDRSHGNGPSASLSTYRVAMLTASMAVSRAQVSSSCFSHSFFTSLLDSRNHPIARATSGCEAASATNTLSSPLGSYVALLLLLPLLGRARRGKAVCVAKNREVKK